MGDTSVRACGFLAIFLNDFAVITLFDTKFSFILLLSGISASAHGNNRVYRYTAAIAKVTRKVGTEFYG